MTDKCAREIVADAARESSLTFVHGDCSVLAREILAALEAGGFAVVERKRLEVIANCASTWTIRDVDGAIRPFSEVARLMLAASNPKEEGK